MLLSHALCFASIWALLGRQHEATCQQLPYQRGTADYDYCTHIVADSSVHTYGDAFGASSSHHATASLPLHQTMSLYAFFCTSALTWLLLIACRRKGFCCMETSPHIRTGQPLPTRCRAPAAPDHPDRLCKVLGCHSVQGRSLLCCCV